MSPATPALVTQATALALTLGSLVKQMPSTKVLPDGGVQIYWKPEQLPAVRAWVRQNVIKAAGKPGISLDLLPVIMPDVLKIGLPAALLLILAGRMTKGRGRR